MQNNENEQGVLRPDYENIVKKVRKVCKLFRQSPVKNDESLQVQIKKNLGKELNLLLDVRTRWNSLVKMIRRFLLLEKEVRHALLDISKPFDFSSGELKDLKDLADALEPLEVATNALSTRDATLVTAETVIEFTIETFEKLQSPIADDLKEAFIKRIDQRRDHKLAHLVNYLNHPGYVSKGKDVLGHRITKVQIIQSATELIKRLFSIDVNEEIAATGADDNDVGNRTLSEQLNLRIQAQNKEAPNNKEIRDSIVKQEIALYDKNPSKRPDNLEKLFNALMSIPPTSIESERNFSTTTYFATKIRSRLNDDTLSALVFLKNYYKKVKN